MLYALDPSSPDAPFPDVEAAETEPDGLLAMGGDLSDALLIGARYGNRGRLFTLDLNALGHRIAPSSCSSARGERKRFCFAFCQPYTAFVRIDSSTLYG